MIDRNQFNQLITTEEIPTISLFMPTHQKGSEQEARQDAIRFKNLIKEGEKLMRESGVDKEIIEEYIRTTEQLTSDVKFWRYQEKGLSLFVVKDQLSVLQSPLTFDPLVRFGMAPFILPLIPQLYASEQTYFVLKLKKEGVQLYKGNPFSIKECDISDKVPKRLEDVVGYDYEDRHVAFRSAGPGGPSKFSGGYGGTIGDDKEEILRYFRAINKGILPLLHKDPNAPLVISCQEHYFPIYSQANTYAHLYHSPIPEASKDPDPKTLRTHLEPFFSKDRDARLESYSSLAGTGKTSRDIHAILNAAQSGRIDTVFVAGAGEIKNVATPTQESIYQPEATKDDMEVMINKAVIEVITKGGRAYAALSSEFPGAESAVYALLRY